jgi:glycosyltransferase involved in cell wall biosynthesis
MPEKVQLRVLTHHQNQGKGAAVKTGCLAATGRYVVFTDIDLASPLEDCEGVLKALSESADVVAGTRVQPGGYDMRRSQPLSRRVMGRVFTFFRSASSARHRRHAVPTEGLSARNAQRFPRPASLRLVVRRKIPTWRVASG